MTHPTRLVRFGDLEAEIDEEVADLVVELWRADIDTASSCQDEGESILMTAPPDSPWMAAAADREMGRAYVDFPWPQEACRFYDAVANGGRRDGLYLRMVLAAAEGAWEARIGVYDTVASMGVGDWSAPSEFATGVVRVRFPRADIPAVAARLRRFNAGEIGPHLPPGDGG